MAEYERYTYRQIGERLGISADAARLKAKRMSQKGRWRLIPGNHPQDTVHVDVPTGTLVTLNGHDKSPPTRASGDGDGTLHVLIGRIEALTEQLLCEKDAHGSTRCELAAAETRELGTKRELELAIAEVQQLRLQLRRRWWRR